MKPFPVLLGILAFGLSTPGEANDAAHKPEVPAPVTIPPTTVAPPPQVGTARIVMLRLYVSDITKGAQLYHEVLGANVMQSMGSNVRIMVFPGGGMPGIILIQSPEVATMHGSLLFKCLI